MLKRNIWISVVGVILCLGFYLLYRKTTTVVDITGKLQSNIILWRRGRF